MSDPGSEPAGDPARETALEPAVAGRLKRNADGLVAAIVQQHDTHEVLMLGWMDDEALRRTLTTGRGTYWSRSRQEYWVKGETSGNTQRVVEVRLDCDGDTVLVKVDQTGPACHTGAAHLLRRGRPAGRTATMTERGSSRSSFGPVVLLGLVSAGLAAVASAKPWLDAGSSDGSSDATMTAVDTGTRYPLASAISLVLLAAWGVLLVTRGRVRRVFAVLATLAAVALVVSVVVAYVTLPDAAGNSFDEQMGRGAGDSRVHRLVLDGRGVLGGGSGSCRARRTTGAGLARDGQQVRRTGDPHARGSRGRVPAGPVERARRGPRPHRHRSGHRTVRAGQS